MVITYSYCSLASSVKLSPPHIPALFLSFLHRLWSPAPLGCGENTPVCAWVRLFRNISSNSAFKASLPLVSALLKPKQFSIWCCLCCIIFVLKQPDNISFGEILAKYSDSRMHKGLNSLYHKSKSENTVVVIIIKQMKSLDKTLYSKII